MKRLLALLALVFPLAAFAVPVTFEVTPTFSAPTTGGAPSGYKAYRGDANTQTTLIGPAVSGTKFTFTAEPTPAPVVCVKAWNAAGEGTCNPTPLVVTAPPGPTTTTYTCNLNPVTGGTCTPAP